LTRTKILTIALGFFITADVSFAFGSTLKVERSSVVMTAGQTVEIPLSSDHPIAADLKAKGAFEPGDVTIIDGPGCRLSAQSCTLMITASRTSKNYKAVPVMVSESKSTNSPIFLLSVIAGESAPVNTKLPEKVHEVEIPVRIVTSPSVVTHTEETIQRSGNALFYAETKPHPGPEATEKNIGHFTAATNGPSYQIVALTNRDTSQSLSVALTGSGASHFTIDDTASNYRANRNCSSMNRIGSGDSCIIIVKGEIGDPRKEPEMATLTIRGDKKNVATFELGSTTYVYAAGGFNTLGNANVSGGDLLAECTGGTCSNALQGTTGNNYASTNFSVGQWINALAITPAGNLLVGGVFGEIGGATSGASSSTAALLAQCTPGSVVGNSCINQISTGATANAYASNAAYINGITSPFAIGGSSFIGVAGDFANIRSSSVTAGQKMLAKCAYSGTSPNVSCSNFLGASNKFANNAIAGLNTLGTTSGNPVLNVGGLFSQILSYPNTPPVSGTTFATCSTTACSQGMGGNNPNNSILTMSDDGLHLYAGGTFSQIGGYTDNTGGYPLVSCTLDTTTTCTNALTGSDDANGYIQGITFSGSSLYVGGRFTTIGGATPVSGGNMLAECTVGGACTNFVTDTNPYASGTDWGGGISAVAVGTQTKIMAR
jgi:cell division septation protein DedD